MATAICPDCGKTVKTVQAGTKVSLHDRQGNQIYRPGQAQQCPGSGIAATYTDRDGGK